ncbi:DM13 domain-containing protein [Patescibacteria group bacterium]|nr:DM13 domain-containing protein [Patescibacteria group bacterium]MBU1123561.1 DM13 domain-containing protein [Patescibacteria group bacterium]
MKRLLLISTVFLTACASITDGSPDAENNHASIPLKERLVNPLFAEQYSKAMTERLTELVIDKDPIIEDEKKARYVEDTKRYWMDIDRKSRKLQQQGLTGQFVGDKEYVIGEALLINNILFLGTKFETDPGPELHIFLSEVLDPRDLEEFPDPSFVDLGALQSPYGAQRYGIPVVTNIDALRTVILWDNQLKRLYGFAQLSK